MNRAGNFALLGLVVLVVTVAAIVTASCAGTGTPTARGEETIAGDNHSLEGATNEVADVIEPAFGGSHPAVSDFVAVSQLVQCIQLNPDWESEIEIDGLVQRPEWPAILKDWIAGVSTRDGLFCAPLRAAIGKHID